MKFVLLINLKLLTIANSFLLNIAEHEKSFKILGLEEQVEKRKERNREV